MTSSTAASSSAPARDENDALDPAVWRIAIAIIVGAFMSVIDMTIVNVALEDLGRDLKVSGFDQIQWVMTAYMLAVAAVIPITGWVVERFGGRRIFLASLVLFTAASALCAAAWNLESLVVFRILQGIAGGALMPVGQIMLARAAGPNKMGRVMSVIGVPILLAPVLGPVLGGLMLKYLTWHWIFLVNVPVGILGVTLAMRMLPGDHHSDLDHRTDRRLDWTGLALLSIGLPLIVYGLANVAGAGIDATKSWGPIAAGLALTIAFTVHAWHSSNPLLDVRLARNVAFSMSALTTFALGAFLFGSMILLPLYYQVGRGEDVLNTGLLLAPQGIGAAIGMFIAGRLSDRIGGGIVTLGGLAILLVATIPFTWLDGSTSYWLVSGAMLVRGIGFGGTMMPAMAAAYAALNPKDISHATPQLMVLQRVGGSVGTAILATILQSKIEHSVAAASAKLAAASTAAGASTATAAASRHVGGEGGGTEALRSAPPAIQHAAAGAFGDTFMWVMVTTAVAVLPALALTLAERSARRRRERQLSEPSPTPPLTDAVPARPDDDLEVNAELEHV